MGVQVYCFKIQPDGVHAAGDDEADRGGGPAAHLYDPRHFRQGRILSSVSQCLSPPFCLSLSVFPPLGLLFFYKILVISQS